MLSGGEGLLCGCCRNEECRASGGTLAGLDWMAMDTDGIPFVAEMFAVVGLVLDFSMLVVSSFACIALAS